MGAGGGEDVDLIERSEGADGGQQALLVGELAGGEQDVLRRALAQQLDVEGKKVERVGAADRRRRGGTGGTGGTGSTGGHGGAGPCRGAAIRGHAGSDRIGRVGGAHAAEITAGLRP